MDPDQNRLMRRSWKIAGWAVVACPEFLKEDPTLQKAIGLITCASVMAVSLYLFSGGDPSQSLSAMTDTHKSGGYNDAARKMLQEARAKAKQGKTADARRLAQAAASMSTDWSESEESPEEFLESLDATAAKPAKEEFAFAEESDSESMEPDSEEVNPFEEAAAAEEEAEEAGVTSSELLKKKQAQRLVKEARQAIAAGDTALARSRAIQARQLNASWGLWDDRPEHVIAELDKKEKTSTFVAGGKKPAASAMEIRSKDAEHEYQQASSLLKQARAAMDAGKLAEAQQLADKAASFDVAYGIFEDSPELVARDIKRLQGAKSGSESLASAKPDTSPDAIKARKLLREAREALLQGRMSVAREKANEASRLNVAYNVLDDRPELVMADIDSAMRGQGKSARNQTNNVAAVESTASKEARNLVSQARGALKSGDHQKAHELAVQAQQHDAAFGLMEDRPELVLEEAQLMAQRDKSKSVNRAIAKNNPVDVTDENPFASEGIAPVNFDGAEFPAIATEGESASQLYRQGIAMFRSGDRAGAKAAFTQASKNAGELSSTERRQLKDFLQALAQAPEVELASGQDAQESGDAVDVTESELPMNPMNEMDPLTAATEESDVRYDRLRTEVMNSVFRAEKMKTENPAEALTMLDNTLATIEAAPLNKESLETLAGYVRRTQDSIRAYQEQQGPNLAQAQKNKNVMEQIKRETETKIRIEQDFAKLVDEYNQLMKEHRYAEAELVAKKARDLNPDLPQSTIMVEKAKLQRQIAFNADVKERKADSFLDQLNKVEEAAIAPTKDYNLPDAKSWGELVKRREKYGMDNRERTESEMQIEKSLGQKVSLHFHDVPLTEVIRHIATVHGINIAMKSHAIETEGLTTSQPVTIDVDGITLRSALNLLLDQAGGLVYSIENETLMITNRLEQETKFEVITYNVADLVIPVSVKVDPSASMSGGATMRQVGSSGNGLYQVNDDLNLGIPGSAGSRGDSAAGSSVGNADFSGLIDLITTTIEPGTWDVDGGAGTIGTEENTLSLVIRQTSAAHEDIADLLKQLRKLQDLQVTVEVRFISVSDNFFERIGVDFDFNIQDSLGDPPGVPAFGSRQLTFPVARLVRLAVAVVVVRPVRQATFAVVSSSRVARVASRDNRDSRLSREARRDDCSTVSTA